MVPSDTSLVVQITLGVMAALGGRPVSVTLPDGTVMAIWFQVLLTRLQQETQAAWRLRSGDRFHPVPFFCPLAWDRGERRADLGAGKACRLGYDYRPGPCRESAAIGPGR